MGYNLLGTELIIIMIHVGIMGYLGLALSVFFWKCKLLFAVELV